MQGLVKVFTPLELSFFLELCCIKNPNIRLYFTDQHKVKWMKIMGNVQNIFHIKI